MERTGMLLLMFTFVPSLRAEATCPCLAGGEWSFEGKNYLYCANPNSARASWCPTADAKYDGGDFAFCEGETLVACTALKQAAQQENTECPCQEEWSYRKKLYNYCKTDTDCDAWCPIKPELVAKYGRNNTYCTDAILEACEAERDTKPKPTCPCLQGGQWKYKGEPQSYCSNPTKNKRAPWCYADNGAVKYCHGDIEKACQELEGSAPVETEHCPCLDGGKWTVMGVDMSYCQLGSCPRTHGAINFNGPNWSKCGKKEKTACDALKSLETPEGKTAMFGQYTFNSTGCPCWYDMTKNDCACCNDGAVQCGAPMQNFCYKKSEGRQRGCPGVPASQWTLSTTGHPCAGDPTRNDCAWCAPGGGQCRNGEYGADSAHGNRCWDTHDEDYCGVTTAATCDVTHKCDSMAECVFDRKFGANLMLKTCKCKAGWIGNGIECFDATTGEASPEVSSDGDVSLTLVMKTELFTIKESEVNSTNSTVPGAQLLTNIDALFADGEQCSKDAACNGTYAVINSTP